MESNKQTFPIGNKDLDRLLLLRFDDRALLNTLSLGTKNRLINKYLNDETFWILRFEQKYPSDFETAQKLKHRLWKDFSLLLIKYLDLAKGNYNTAMKLAARGGHHDLVDFFIYKGADYWNTGMQGAAQGGHHDLVDFFIYKGANDWDSGMFGAAQGGHRDLVDFFISKGAREWHGL